MHTFVLGPLDASRFRFGSSAMWETANAVRTLRDPVQQAYHRPWLAGLPIPELLDELACLSALSPDRGWTADFLSPAPTEGQRPDPDRELALVRRTPLEHVARDLRLVAASHPPGPARRLVEELAADPAAARDRVADALTVAWQRLVAPWWPQVSRLIDDDLAVRSAALVQHGLSAAVEGIDPRVHWRGDHLDVEGRPAGRTQLAGRGLLLVPSAFSWPRLAVMDHPWPPALTYPARGIGTLWSPGPPAGDTLTRLLGRHRARVLTALDAEATTTDLARRLDLTPAAVSRHLTLLQAAGLATSRRVGREVRYRLTATGTAVRAGADPPG